MNVKFIQCSTLPDTYMPGGIYFIENEGAIYVASSETKIIKYSCYTELQNKQNNIEDLEEIRTGTLLVKNIPVVDDSDIDNLFI